MHNGWGLTQSSALWEDGVEPERVRRHRWLLLIEPERPWERRYEVLGMQEHCTVSCLVLWPTRVTQSTRAAVESARKLINAPLLSSRSHAVGRRKSPWRSKPSCKQCRDELQETKPFSPRAFGNLITENYWELLVRNLFNEHSLPWGQNGRTTRESLFSASIFIN